MPYTSRHLINTLAHGKPLPKGEPEDLLFHALEMLHPMDVEQATSIGANARRTDRQGRPAFHVLLDAWDRRPGHPERLLSCAMTLYRMGVDFRALHPQSKISVAERSLVLLQHPAIARRWFHAVEHRLEWGSVSSTGQPLWQAAAERADGAVKVLLEQRFSLAGPSSRRFRP